MAGAARYITGCIPGLRRRRFWYDKDLAYNELEIYRKSVNKQQDMARVRFLDGNRAPADGVTKLRGVLF